MAVDGRISHDLANNRKKCPNKNFCSNVFLCRKILRHLTFYLRPQCVALFCNSTKKPSVIICDPLFGSAGFEGDNNCFVLPLMKVSLCTHSKVIRVSTACHCCSSQNCSFLVNFVCFFLLSLIKQADLKNCVLQAEYFSHIFFPQKFLNYSTTEPICRNIHPTPWTALSVCP